MRRTWQQSNVSMVLGRRLPTSVKKSTAFRHDGTWRKTQLQAFAL